MELVMKEFAEEQLPEMTEIWNDVVEEGLSFPGDKALPEQEALKMFREQARLVCTRQAAHYSKIMGVTFGRIALKNTKTRWGSRSSLGNLNFHWKLVLMPPEILDYVVVHELAHRKEMNHSPLFWKKVAAVLPDYRERRAWLREHGRDY